jgi:phosphonoacetaldehyde hydrolase
MIFRAMEATGIYPVGDVLKIGDTRVDIEDGCNAGVHSWGVVDSSNEMGLSLAAFKSLPASERQNRRQAVAAAFQSRGAERSIYQLEEMIPYLDGALTEPQR